MMISGYFYKFEGRSIAAIDLCSDNGFYISKNIKKEFITPLAAAGALIWVMANPGNTITIVKSK